MFNKKETKEEKKARKQAEEMARLKDRYHLETMSDEDYEIIKRITADLTGNEWFKAGMALSFAKAEDQATVTYLSALVEQNWLIFRKLDEISKKLDKL